MVKEEFIDQFRNVLRRELVKHRVITIDGLGTFRVNHDKQRQEQYPNGQVVLLPPKDSIQFTPEEE